MLTFFGLKQNNLWIDFVSDNDFDVFNNFEIEGESSTGIGDKYTDENNT